jgi:hypothetical protein
MLDDILTVLKPTNRSKMTEAEPQLTASLPPIDSKISFRPLITYLREKRSTVSDMRSGFYNYLIEKFEAEPALSEVIKDIKLIEDHDELMDLLGTLLFPVVSQQEKNTFALTAPYQFKTFFCSECFCQMFLDKCGEHLLLPANLTPDQLKTIQCSMIYDHVLETFYGVRLNDAPELIYPVMDEQTGLKRFYRIRYDRRFIDIKLNGQLPSLEDCAVCLNTFRILDLEQQLQKMPLDLFSVEGFAVWVAEDVTSSESLENIKKTLIRQNECDTEIITELKEAVHALVGLTDVSIGLMPFVQVNDQYVMVEECLKHSLLGRQLDKHDPASVQVFKEYIDLLHQMPVAFPVTVLDEKVLQPVPLLRPLVEQGYRSYLHYPMVNSDGLLGILELATTTPHTLNHEVVTRLEPAMPLLSVAMLKSRNSFHDRIEKLIKEKFTALQESVQWKFTEVAWNQLQEATTCPANVVFDDVYPLYGAIDIRNSSQERINALQKDLKVHLGLIDSILEELTTTLSLPLLEGLKFKNETILRSIQDSMMAEDEVRINEFIEDEVESVLRHLQQSSPAAQVIVEKYFEQVHGSDELNRHRKEYEEAMQTINDTVLQYLEGEETGLQKSYPHYFERYRTDGVEYNIYIGQSISPSRPFDILYLKNMRLWQLKSMAEAARITHQLLPSLKVPLQTTQLILVHGHCLSIAFRRDERRFDVEGSYNIRYEIIKKRLDKARIKDTDERLTQPGKIAMVYYNTKELQEYTEYIEFLQNKGALAPGIEVLELEEMQGVKGLKAMRVSIVLPEA